MDFHLSQSAWVRTFFWALATAGAMTSAPNARTRERRMGVMVFVRGTSDVGDSVINSSDCRAGCSAEPTHRARMPRARGGTRLDDTSGHARDTARNPARR